MSSAFLKSSVSVCPHSVLKKFHSGERFGKVFVSVFFGYVWTEVVSVMKKLLLQMKRDTYRQGLSLINYKQGNDMLSNHVFFETLTFFHVMCSCSNTAEGQVIILI